MTFPLRSVTFKVLGIGLLALLMQIPLSQVAQVVAERVSLRSEAKRHIAERGGQPQLLGGPVLVGRWRERGAAGWVGSERTQTVLPDTLDLAATLSHELRSYGIYSTPVYNARTTLHARFDPAELKQLREVAGALDAIDLRFPLSDVRGLRQVAKLRVNGTEQRLAAGADFSGLHTLAVQLAPDDVAAGLEVEAELTIGGTDSLQLLPLARTTSVKLDATWPDPSFIGAFGPATRSVGPEGFSATWQVLDLNRGFSQGLALDEVSPVALQQSAFGVALFQPVDLYQRNERSVKYGLLFVGLTFVAFFLFEVLKRWRVHPVQYILVGLALTTFYVVLLALSEVIGFGPAYAAAAAAVVLMVGGYASAVLATRAAGVLLGAALALVYGLLYGLVVSEQYSLLIGAIALLAVVGALMFLTRKVDWYSYGPRAEPAQ